MKLNEKSINAEKAVFLPFYGEYGWFLSSYIRLVHYYSAYEKVVCCRRGEEVYFPSATSFFYAWKDIFQDNEKCGYRDTWPISPVFKEKNNEKKLKSVLIKQYPDAKLIQFNYAIPPELVHYFPVPIQQNKIFGIHPDIVICARKRLANGYFGDWGTRNFDNWHKIINPLVQQGFKIGIIGKEETSYDFPALTYRSWEYENNTNAIIEMLTNTKLYIGTDTGPTHLAALLKTPMIVFRNENETLSQNMLESCIIPIARRQGVPAQIIKNGWNNPKNILRAVETYLSRSSN